MCNFASSYCFFFFNDTATSEIYTYCHTLSLHDALPISVHPRTAIGRQIDEGAQLVLDRIIDHRARRLDRIEFPLDVGETRRSRLGLGRAVLEFGLKFADERVALIRAIGRAHV